MHFCYFCFCWYQLINWTKICLTFLISFIFSACPAHVVVVVVVVGGGGGFVVDDDGGDVEGMKGQREHIKKPHVKHK